MRILICTDGSSAAEQAGNLVRLMKFPEETSVTLLGVSESKKDKDDLEASLGRIAVNLQDRFPNLNKRIRTGQPYDEILAEAIENAYDLVSVGGAGQQHGLLNFKLGSTTSKLARKIHTHFLVARTVPKEIKKILVCTGAEAPSVETMQVGGALISGLPAEVSVLHVVSQVAVKPDATVEELQINAESAIVKKTREGQRLQKAMDRLRAAGVAGTISPVLRHGLVVDEVLAEAAKGKYDLMVVGAHYQPGQNRWFGMLLDDVTDRLLNNSACSVLIV